jgi:hypothetical protein
MLFRAIAMGNKRDPKDEPALVENASLKVCSVILLAHLKRYQVHAFNRESHYLLQTSTQVGVNSMMGAHIKERNFIGLEDCNFRSPRSPHSFAQSTILILTSLLV